MEDVKTFLILRQVQREEFDYNKAIFCRSFMQDVHSILSETCQLFCYMFFVDCLQIWWWSWEYFVNWLRAYNHRVALPFTFRDLHQPTRNVTYFVSVIRKKCVQHNLKLVHKQSQNHGAHDLFIKSADENRKKKVSAHGKVEKRSVNLPFKKSLNR